MENKNPKFVFFGTPDVASETLAILKDNGYLPGLIVTSPDKPQGRKMLITPPPAKVWAEENHIPFIQPEKLTEEKLAEVKYDFFLVVAYGKIIPEKILNMPRLGSVNIHYSLLPKYRGASPVESAILSGDKKTGVTIQKMKYELDQGPVIAEEVTPIGENEKAPELRQRLIKIGGELMVKILPKFIEGGLTEKEQDESQATYCKKIKKEDGLIDPNGDPVLNYNKFRAYASWPRTFFFSNGKRVIVTDAFLEDGKFVIRKVLPEGRKEITWQEFENSTKA